MVRSKEADERRSTEGWRSRTEGMEEEVEAGGGGGEGGRSAGAHLPGVPRGAGGRSPGPRGGRVAGRISTGPGPAVGIGR